MRISLCFFVVISHLVSCGMVEQRAHIDEQYSQTDYKEADIAFHSSTGWNSVVAFYVDNDAPDQIVEASMAAADSWNDAVGFTVLQFSGVTDRNRGESLYSSLNDLDTVVYYEEDWLNTTGKSSSTLATTIWENATGSDEIVKADIIINAELYRFVDSTDTTEEWDSTDIIVDAETVLLHEFGHLLGLDHVSAEDDEDSIMHANTFVGPNMKARVLSQGDADHIQELYN